VNDQLTQFIEHARWFGGKGRPFRVTACERHPLPDPDPAEERPADAARSLEQVGRAVTVELVTLTYGDASGGTDLYQVPVSYYRESQIELNHALVGVWDDPELGMVFAYDALHDHAATPAWLHAFAEGSRADGLAFHRVGDAELDLGARSTLLTGEQSNSSVAFGDDTLMKLFRRVTPGRNPDIEILEALTHAGNEHVAALHGWVETTRSSGETLQLGLLQQFLRTASDGWELALASLRNLYAEGVLHAEESGGDFASEAQRLGVAVAEMHTTLAEHFPTETWGAEDLGRIADEMNARLDAALDVVPELAEHADGLRRTFDAIRETDEPVVAQRIHGDLHLGQTLRTVRNWKIIDFEGEPAKTLEERRRPDSAWRDVAGMVRSFDYAAELTRIDHEQSVGDVDSLDEPLAREWADRNLTAFLLGYQESTGHQVDRSVLAAYAADKAVYEAVYEARNRPTWLPIPLGALRRLAQS
jgi:maltokinase